MRTRSRWSTTAALIVGMGGRFLVCGHCARIAGVDGAQLRRGFTIGGPEDIAAMYMAADLAIDF